MELKDFSYFLPDELIAQHPCQQRDRSHLLFLDKKKEEIADFSFFQLPDFLQSGDVLVINDSKVIPARLFGKKPTGGILEILLLTKKKSEKVSQTWEVLLRPAKRLRENDIIALGNNCEAKVLARISDKKWLLEFFAPDGFEAYLNSFGRAPLPPYIKRKKTAQPNVADRERYQTIYAKNPGSVAAPTAGLHFSADVLQTLQAKGIRIAPITLHVGYGTFLPIEVNEVEKHVMESEYYEINAESSQIINNAQRIIAVGTTSTRTLESVANNDGYVQAKSGTTNFFIYPGYKFKRVNGLLTNFHLPQSSLFLLVCAFAGTDLIKKVYQHAVEKSYLFYSYGDCMLIL
ncbi:MAG: tRNA preQ1(34) S-adenosylmethionine ribosyltransferase-isomerase QueA [Deltaproteobacteria bacterium]|nr:tRNA preQ1(34) S-adenosylmethionine ribosyltransferase-isomerase QueA [Deltaproteobacteria bacterium]